MSNEFSPLQESRGVITKLSTGLHTELRALLFRKGVTLQRLYEHLAISLVDGNEHAIALLDEIVKEREGGAALPDTDWPRFSRPPGTAPRGALGISNPDVLYDLLEQHDPTKR